MIAQLFALVHRSAVCACFSLPEVCNRDDPISSLLRHHVAHGQQHGDGDDDGYDSRVTTETPAPGLVAPLAPSRRSLRLVSPRHGSARRRRRATLTAGRRCGVWVECDCDCDCVLAACGRSGTMRRAEGRAARRAERCAWGRWADGATPHSEHRESSQCASSDADCACSPRLRSQRCAFESAVVVCVSDRASSCRRRRVRTAK